MTDALLTTLSQDPATVGDGRATFVTNCVVCHGDRAQGNIGPNLTDDHWLHGCGIDHVVQSIKTGYPVKGMMPFGTGKTLTDQQVLQVASYVLSKHGSNPPNPKPSEPDRDADCK